MERNRRAVGFAAATGILILILDGKTAFAGAAEGIDLCIRSVIPALFPFFVLTPLLVGNLSPGFLRPLARWMGLPAGMEGLLIPAFLGGYPMGAQAVGRARIAGSLSREDAQRLLHFCSNAGPSFLFGMIGPQFSSPHVAWLLWGIHILSAMLVSRSIPGSAPSRRASLQLSGISLQPALSGAVKTMGLVCGWVIVFRILISFLNRWILWILPKEAAVLICGLLELSNGCCMLSEIPDPQIRFLICTLLLSFGGCCVAMQTAAVIPGLSILPYLKGKLMQTVYSLALSSLILQDPQRWVLIIPAILLFFGCRKFFRKNNSRNPAASIV
jgi:hypothetical protein